MVQIAYLMLIKMLIGILKNEMSRKQYIFGNFFQRKRCLFFSKEYNSTLMILVLIYNSACIYISPSLCKAVIYAVTLLTLLAIK